ncbi:MAG: caspase family protein [Rhodobacteraceae bacterium]|nr:caspase family protein [Paracoccaceae bacterium]
MRKNRLGITLRKVLAWLFIFCGAPILVTADERRVALVIGNGSYKQLASLPNAVGDAEAISQSLSALGFTVFLTTDLDQAHFRKAISFFQTRVADADTSLLYFAGHGATLAGRSYLFPTDFGRADLYDMREAVDLDGLINNISSDLRTNLVFIDACRDNPLQSQSQPVSDLFGLPQGLLSKPRVGTLISFATTPGHIAYDGLGNHSPYTGALLDHLETPGVDIELVLRRVRRDVMVNSQGQQVPWTETSLLSGFQLAPVTLPDQIGAALSTSGAGGNQTLLSVLSDTGFGSKPLLQRISNGISVGSGPGQVTLNAETQARRRRSDRIRALLCTVVEPPLPAHCNSLQQ